MTRAHLFYIAILVIGIVGIIFWRRGVRIPQISTGWISSTGTWVRDNLSVGLGALLIPAALVFAFALWAFLLPDLAYAFWSAVGTVRLLLILAAAYIIGLIIRNVPNWLARWALIILIAAPLAGSLYLSIPPEKLAEWEKKWTEWNKKTDTPPAPRVATAPRCPGTLESVLVGTDKWVLIRPHPEACSITWDVAEGRALLGEPHRYVEDWPGNLLEETRVKIIYAKAEKGRAQIDFILCPPGKAPPPTLPKKSWKCKA